MANGSLCDATQTLIRRYYIFETQDKQQQIDLEAYLPFLTPKDETAKLVWLVSSEKGNVQGIFKMSQSTPVVFLMRHDLPTLEDFMLSLGIVFSNTIGAGRVRNDRFWKKNMYNKTIMTYYT